MYRNLKVNDGTTGHCQNLGEGNTSNKVEEPLGTIPVGFDLSPDPVPITREDLLCFNVRSKVSDKLSGPWLEEYINVYVCCCD